MRLDGIVENGLRVAHLGRAGTVDDFVVRESLRVPSASTGFYNSLNRHEFKNGQKPGASRNSGICLLSRVRVPKILT